VVARNMSVMVRKSGQRFELVPFGHITGIVAVNREGVNFDRPSCDIILVT
jgi:hypothetical protein